MVDGKSTRFKQIDERSTPLPPNSRTPTQRSLVSSSLWETSPSSWLIWRKQPTHSELILPTPLGATPSSTVNHTPFGQTSPAWTHSTSSTSSTSSHRLPKLEVTFFSGENVLVWLFQIEIFFSYHRISVDQKLDIATFGSSPHVVSLNGRHPIVDHLADLCSPSGAPIRPANVH